MKKLLIVLLTICTLFLNVGVFAEDADPTGLVTSVTYDSANETITVVCDEIYMAAITDFKLDYWETHINDPVVLSKTSTSFTFPSRNALGDRTGTFVLVLYADGYKDFSCNVIIGEPSVNYPSDLSIELNADGDLIIYSEDIDYMNELVSSYKEEEHEVLEGMVRSKTNEDFPDYYFGVHNAFGEGVRDFSPLEYDRENNIVIFSVANQKNIDLSQVYRGQLLNDVDYTINLTVRGYDTYEAPGTFRFVNSNVRIPTDEVGIYLADGYLIVKASDNSVAQDFLNNIYSAAIAKFDSEDLVVDGTLINAGELITGDVFDTIDSKHDRVYKLYDNVPKDLTGYEGIINSAGYGQYCWDGRPFGGEVYIKTEKFNVTLKGNGGEGESKASEELGEFKLPSIDPVSGKEIVGWQIVSKGEAVNRCVGEVVFITSNTEIYAIYKDSPTPVKVDPQTIVNSAYEVKVIDVEENVYDAKLGNTEFVSESDIEKGVSVWVEVTEGTQVEKEQLNWALSKLTNEGTKVLDVFDANVFKKVGETDSVKVSETDDYVELVFDLTNANEDILKLANEGKLGVVSVHNGVLQESVGGVYDASTKLFTVKVNEFSVYGLIEADGQVINNETNKKPGFVIPKTGVR